MLLIGSILLVLVMSSYCIFHFNRNKENHSVKMEVTTSLLVGVSAAVFGFLVMLASGYHLAITAIVSFVFALVAGRLAGVGGSSHKIKGIHQILSGFVGASLGSLLGYMTFRSDIILLVVDVLFILFVYFILRLFDKQIVTQPKKKTTKQSGVPTYALVSSLIVIGILILLNTNSIKLGAIGQPETKQAVMDEENDLQVATIHVTASGFDPRNTMIKANTMVKMIFKTEIGEGETVELVSTDLKLNVKLKDGENTILLDNPQPGKYDYTIDSGKFSGTLTVK